MTTLTRLWGLAADQHGYVTSHDAEAQGVTASVLVKAGERGRLHRAAYGVYRFPEIPVDEFDPYTLATLWPAKRGVLSHETALQLHDLCDVEPEKIHLTVPCHYRVRRRGGEAYVVHHEDLEPSDLASFDGMRIVTPERAICQAIDTAVAPHLVAQAIDNGRRRGRLTKGAADALHARLARRDG